MSRNRRSSPDYTDWIAISVCVFAVGVGLAVAIIVTHSYMNSPGHGEPDPAFQNAFGIPPGGPVVEVSMRDLLVDYQTNPAKVFADLSDKRIMLQGIVIRSMYRESGGTYRMMCNMPLSEEERFKFGKVAIRCSQNFAMHVQIGGTYDFEVWMDSDRGNLQFRAIE